jgi:hypothetical protein
VILLSKISKVIRLVKTIREEWQLRGYYSYLGEAVIEIMWAKQKFPEEEIKVFFDLTNVHHYKQQNLFDVCFIQDHDDFFENKHLYTNIESLKSEIILNHYELSTIPQDIRDRSELIIQEYFRLKPEFEQTLNERLGLLDLKTTISVHRRDTDMKTSHHITAPSLQQFYDIIDEENYTDIFVMSDNKTDLNLFKEKYPTKVISFEENTTSTSSEYPYFLLSETSPEEMRRHVENLTINTFVLSKTKKLICTKSNLSTFAILANPKLNYTKLN